MAGPAVEEVLPHHLIKVTSVRHEGRRQQDVSQDGRHLHLEGLTTSLPAFSLNGQTAQEGCATVNLEASRYGNSLIYAGKFPFRTGIVYGLHWIDFALQIGNITIFFYCYAFLVKVMYHKTMYMNRNYVQLPNWKFVWKKNKFHTFQ